MSEYNEQRDEWHEALLRKLKEKQEAANLLLQTSSDESTKELVALSDDALEFAPAILSGEGTAKEQEGYEAIIDRADEITDKTPSIRKDLKDYCDPFMQTTGRRDDEFLEEKEEGYDSGIEEEEAAALDRENAAKRKREEESGPRLIRKPAPEPQDKDKGPEKPRPKKKSRLQEWLDFIKSLPAPRDEGEALAQLLVLIFIPWGLFKRKHHEKAEESFMRVINHTMEGDKKQQEETEQLKEQEALFKSQTGSMESVLDIRKRSPDKKEEEEYESGFEEGGETSAAENEEPDVEPLFDIRRRTPSLEEETSSSEESARRRNPENAEKEQEQLFVLRGKAPAPELKEDSSSLEREQRASQKPESEGSKAEEDTEKLMTEERFSASEGPEKKGEKENREEEGMAFRASLSPDFSKNKEENIENKDEKKLNKEQEKPTLDSEKGLELQFQQFLEEGMKSFSSFSGAEEKKEGAPSNKEEPPKEQKGATEQKESTPTGELSPEMRDVAKMSLKGASKVVGLMAESLQSLSDPKTGGEDQQKAEQFKKALQELSENVGKILGAQKPTLQPSSSGKGASEEKGEEAKKDGIAKEKGGEAKKDGMAKNAPEGSSEMSSMSGSDAAGGMSADAAGGMGGFGKSDMERLEKIQNGDQDEKERATVELAVKVVCVSATGGGGGPACEMLAKAAGEMVGKLQEAREQFKHLGTKDVKEFVSALADSVDTSSGPQSKEDQEADKGRAIGEEAMDSMGKTFTKAYETVQKTAGPLKPSQTPSPVPSPSSAEPTQSPAPKPKPS